MAVGAEEVIQGLDLFRVRDGPHLVVFGVQDLPAVVLPVLVLVVPEVVPGGLNVLRSLVHGVRPVLLELLVCRGGYAAPRQQGHRKGQGAEYRKSFHHVLLITKSAG